MISAYKAGVAECRTIKHDIDPELLEKLGYIAEYEGRTKNKELERLVKLHIAKFEQEHGKIEL